MDKPAQWALVGAAWFLALAVALFGFLCWQRLGHARPVLVSEAAVATAAAPSPPVQTAVCPVTGEHIVVGPDTPQVVYLGRTYYFSADRDAQGNDARTRFLMNPDAWLKGSNGGMP
ncbi:MAG: hypothetical protein ACREKE_02385 [bacterium]